MAYNEMEILNESYLYKLRADVFNYLKKRSKLKIFYSLIDKKTSQIDKETLKYLNCIVDSLQNDDMTKYLNLNIEHYDDIIDLLNDSLTYRKYHVFLIKSLGFMSRRKRRFAVDRLYNSVMY